mgnify:CR=1 FL=1
MVKIIMHGCCGHMGQVISQIVKEDADAQIVAGIDPFDNGKMEYPVYKSLEDCKEEADVVIDFASAKAEDALLDYCGAHKLPVVVCTTGLSEEQLTAVEEASKQVAVLKSANMSLGINMLMKILQDAAKILVPAGFDIEIVEKHHNRKLDAPSGTAITLAEGILENIDRKDKWVKGTLVAPDGSLSGNTVYAPDELPVSSVREGEVPGIHTIRYDSEADSISITHDAKNRKGFALGVVLAAEYTAQHEGFLGMNDLFQF